MRVSTNPRAGVSLMEVLVSLTIFVLSFIALGQLITFGGDRALDIQLRTQAALLCESKLNEVTVGAVPLQNQSAVAFDEDPDWTWSLEAEPGSVSSLYTVRVKVARPRSDGGETSVTLARMVFDPAQKGSAFDQIASTASDSSSSSTQDSSSSQNGASSQGGSSSQGGASSGGNAGSAGSKSGAGTPSSAAKSSPTGSGMAASPARTTGSGSSSAGSGKAATPSSSGSSGGRNTGSTPSSSGSRGTGK